MTIAGLICWINFDLKCTGCVQSDTRESLSQIHNAENRRNEEKARLTSTVVCNQSMTEITYRLWIKVFSSYNFAAQGWMLYPAVPLYYVFLPSACFLIVLFLKVCFNT